MNINVLSHKHFQKTVLLIIVCFVCAGVFVGVNAADEKIYEINSLKDLKDFRDSVNKGNPYDDYLVLLNTDIDLSSETNWKPIGPHRGEFIFQGTFDGQGHVISNLTIKDDAGEDYDKGLFGATEGATIKNLVLKNVDAFTTGTMSIGSLIGWMLGGSVTNCSVSGSVSGAKGIECVGGLIGDVWDGKIDNCSVSLEGDVTSGGTSSHKSYLGGLIGYMYTYESSCSISNCYVIGNGHSVSGSKTTDYVGGLIGYGDISDKITVNNEITVNNCFVLLGNGTVKGGGATSGYVGVGGLIGWMTKGSVTNCFVSGEVKSGSSVEYTGGLIGYIDDEVTVNNCYTTQGVSQEVSRDDRSHYLGGLVGRIYGDNCHVHHCVALNPSVKLPDYIGRVTGYKGDADVSQNYGWNKMKVNDETVAGGSPENGNDVSSEDVWETLSFWQNVFGTDSISYDGTKTWTIDEYHYDSNRPWGLPYLTRLGKPSDEQAKNIQYLNPYPIYIPVVINSVDDLKAFRDRVNNGEYEEGAVILNTSLDLKNEEWIPIGNDVHVFRGFFDGQGHVISNLTITGNKDEVGLFGNINSGEIGGIKNLVLENVSVSGNNSVGGLVGHCLSDVDNCLVSGTVTGNNYVGGLVGNEEGNINNCFVYGEISGRDSIGGLAGVMSHGHILNSFASGSIVSDGNDVGGLVGSTWDELNIINSIALNHHIIGSSNMGRISGEPLQTIENTFAWYGMTINGNLVHEGDNNGTNATHSGVWKNLYFWKKVFGENTISDDGSKVWNIVKSDNESLWGIPYLTKFGIPSEKDAEKIQYLKEKVVINISSVADLGNFRDGVNMDQEDYREYILNLTTDLDLGDIPLWDSIGYGAGGEEKMGFSGVFDGNGHTISNMTSYNGLFAVIDGAVVKNLNMKNVSVSGTDIVGGLVGEAELSTLLNCSVTGNVSGNETMVGGLVGYLDNSDICNSSAYCSVSGGGDDVGGLIGHFYNGNIDSCVAYGAVNSTGNWIGGLIGNGKDGNVNNCSAYGEINGVNGVGGLVGAMSYGSITRSFASGFIVGDGNALGGLVGGTGDELKIINSLALNHYINGTPGIERISGGSLQTIENTFAWNNMTLNGNLVHEGGLNGTNATSEDVWKNLTFWQSVFGNTTISDDESKMWNLITSEDPSMWCLPYLTSLGKPSDKDAEKIQYLNPGLSVIYPTDITYNDGQYVHKQTLSQNKLPRITLYKDVFDITKEEGSNQSFSLGTSAPWENYYLWQNHSQPITFADAITDNVSWNALESVDAMKNQNITFALGDENQTSISGTERNVSITVENYLQSYTNNSLDKTRTTDGWFFDTPYTVSLAVRPGPEAYHASEQNGKLWNSHVLIQNLTNNVSKQDSVAWRFATDTQNTTYNTYTVDNQTYLNSTEYLQVKSADSSDGNNVNITLTGYKLGDINRNDVVNINDISAMIKLILAASKDNYTYEAALKTFPNTRIEHLIYADDNKKGGDGKIDVSDLLVINDWLVNGSAHFNYDGWE